MPDKGEAGKLHEISVEIGALKKAVEFMTAMFDRQETSAAMGRRSLHDKFDTLRLETTAQIQTLGLRVDRIVDTMQDVEPAVRSFKEEKLRKEGAERLGKWLIAGMTAVAGGVGWGLHELIAWLRHL